MRFDSVKELRGESFRRLTGVKRNTFEEMTTVLFTAKCKQKAAGGKPNTLGVEDQLLMMLEYWREYRTYFHILPQHQHGAKTAWPKAKLFGCQAVKPLLRATGPSTSS